VEWLKQTRRIANNMGLDTYYTVEMRSPHRTVLVTIKALLGSMKPRSCEYIRQGIQTATSVELALDRCPKGELRFGTIVPAGKTYSMMLEGASHGVGTTLDDWGEESRFRQLKRHFPGLTIQGFFTDDYGWGVIVRGDRVESKNPSLVPTPAFPVARISTASVLNRLEHADDSEWRRFTQRYITRPFVADWMVILLFQVGMQMVAHQPHGLTATGLRRILGLKLEFLDLWPKSDCSGEEEPISLIHAVAGFGRTTDLAMLLEAGAPLTASDRWPHDEIKEAAQFDQPLHAAVLQGKLNNARLLIKAGADVNAAGDHGNTPLHYAARLGNAPCVRLLLQAGHCCDIPNSEGLLPHSLAPKPIRNLFPHR
jgi:hypothetical protein